jgi:putative (di)nucleoside polyphosphate hydrolase
MGKTFSPTNKDFQADRLEGLRPDVVLCAINKDYQVLLGLKAEHQIWEIPQGGIEEGEELIPALEREIKEELGESFLSCLFIPAEPLVAVDQILFPQNTLGGRVLGVGKKKVLMQGKKYYFCVAAKVKDSEPEKKEYADFKWVSFNEGMEIFNAIPQKGKKRILIKIFEILKENGFIK